MSYCPYSECKSHVGLPVLAHIQTYYVLSVIRARADISAAGNCGCDKHNE